MENAKISNLYDLNETIAKEYLEQFTYPWEALKGISEFIKKLGPTLDPEKFENAAKISGLPKVQRLHRLPA